MARGGALSRLFGGKTISREKLGPLLRKEAHFLLYDIIGSLIYAGGIYTFASQAGFAPGGITGAAMILNHLFGLPIGTTAMLLNIPIILISLRFLGKGYLLRTLQTLVVGALFMDVIMPLFPYYTGNPLLAALFAGGLSGIGLSIIYNAGSCTGGSDLIIMTLRKLKPHLSIGQITLLIDGALIAVGAFVYGNIDAVLYGILFTLVSSTVIDKRMYGVVSGKMAMIISEGNHHIGRRIGEELGRGVTFLKGEGMYSQREKEVLLCACGRNQLPKLRSIVCQEDAAAILIVMEYNEVRGQGFLPHDRG